MVAKNKRTNLTLPPDLDDLITDLSKLQERPKAQLITELLLEFKPLLIEVRDALKKIESDKENAHLIAKEFGQKMVLTGSERVGKLATEVKDL